MPETTVAPTPTKPYVTSEVETTAPVVKNPALTDALNRHAGNAAKTPSAAPQTPKAVETPKTAPEPEKAAPHVKFVPLDELDPVATKIDNRPPDEQPSTVTEPSPEVVKAAPAQLREAFQRAKDEGNRLKSEMAAIVAERDLTKKEAAAFREKIKIQEDRVKALESSEVRVKELEAKYQSADERLRVTDYINHQEFHDKFTKPVADAMAAGHELVAQMIADPDGDARQATPQDFEAVLQAGNLTEATRRAKEIFGPDLYQTVVAQRQAVLSAQRARQQAVKEAGLRSQEWVAAQQTRAAEARSQARSNFEQVATGLAEKFPDLYRAPEGDKEATEAYRSGQSLAKLILEGQPPEMAPDKYLESVAKVYHRASSWPMHQLKMTRLQSENQELKAKLAAFERSSPEAGGRLESSGKSSAVNRDDLNSQMHSSLQARARRGR